MDFEAMTEGDIYHAIARFMLPRLPENWQQVTLSYKLVDVDVADMKTTAEMADGESKSIKLSDAAFDIDDLLVELRRRMTLSDAAPWIGATYKLASSGKFDMKFEYPDESANAKPSE